MKRKKTQLSSNIFIYIFFITNMYICNISKEIGITGLKTLHNESVQKNTGFGTNYRLYTCIHVFFTLKINNGNFTYFTVYSYSY